MGRALAARIEIATDGSVEVRSPGVGWWSEPPSVGRLLLPGAAIGRLTRLNDSRTLVLPDGVRGRVVERPSDRLVLPVGYGETLFRLQPIDETGSGGEAQFDESAAAELSDTSHVIASPTDGVFYRGPSPDAEPYVEVGDRVRAGQAVGLVEVMKTFHQLLFDPGPAAAAGTVREIRAGDVSEVRAAEVLLVIDLDVE